MQPVRVGSLFSGADGLGLGVCAALNLDPWQSIVWHCEHEPATEKTPRPSQAAARLLAHRFPDVPNLGDISAVNWHRVPQVDVLIGGSPCQDLSAAGRRLGMRDGTRSGLWTHMCDAIDTLRPRLVVWENVRGALSAEASSDMERCPGCVGDNPDGVVLRALGRLLGDLTDIGYDTRWATVSAASVGAPHQRERVFVTAWPQSGDSDSGDSNGWATAELPGEAGSAAGFAADSGGETVGLRSGLRAGWPASLGRGRPDDHGAPAPAADTAGDGRHQGRSEPTRLIGGSDAAQRGAGVDWGPYGAAIRRWERVLGRVAPAPTEMNTKGGQRLSPAFVEWMMGLPAGWVTAVPGISRNDQLKILGNGVVPQQAAAAVRPS